MNIINNPKLQKVGRVPKWMMGFSQRMVEILRLSDFTIRLKVGDLKSVNRILNRHGYKSLDQNDVAAAVVDTQYLAATLCFVSPIKDTPHGRRIVAHEFLHITQQQRIFDRVRRELTNHYIAPDLQDDVYTILLAVEETSVEQILNDFDAFGLFDAPKRILKKSDKKT